MKSRPTTANSRSKRASTSSGVEGTGERHAQHGTAAQGRQNWSGGAGIRRESPAGDVVNARHVDAAALASLTRHFEFSPVAFAVTEGPTHALVYANSSFRRLDASHAIAIRPPISSGEGVTNLTPVLDRVFREAETVCDEMLAPAGGGEERWSCTVWPIRTRCRIVSSRRGVRRNSMASTRSRAHAQEIAEKLGLRTVRGTESGRLEYHFAEVRVHPALLQVAEMLDGAVKERKLLLDAPADGGGGVVWADADRVHQIAS